MSLESRFPVGVASENDPIFILGLTQRTGTNFLFELLTLHPDCGFPEPIWEDFLIFHSDLLVEYARVVSRHWKAEWGGEHLDEELRHYLGRGLTSFLRSRDRQQRARLVTVTPGIRNARYAFQIFPGSRLLILVRDGRAVAESTVKTWAVTYEDATRKWADAARTLIGFVRTDHGSRAQHLIVRYEDLVSDLERELHRVFLFLGLDGNAYDFDAARKVPIRGSSELASKNRERVHWKPVERSLAFDPLSRFNHWPAWRHARFNWLAGDYLKEWGYPPKPPDGAEPGWAVWNRALDLKWAVQQRARRALMRSRRVENSTFREIAPGPSTADRG